MGIYPLVPKRGWNISERKRSFRWRKWSTNGGAFSLGIEKAGKIIELNGNLWSIYG